MGNDTDVKKCSCKKENMVKYGKCEVLLSQLAELTKIDRNVLCIRYRRGDRGGALIRPVGTELTEGAIMSKRLDVHEVWGGTWYYKGQKVFTDERLKALRFARGAEDENCARYDCEKCPFTSRE